KYQYTGFTKEAINKTQNVGYKNEYFISLTRQEA
ncbi:PF07901 domain protein, partial [Staphylococcus aureus subsp. aureus CO-86]